jgi:hypothetical protein
LGHFACANGWSHDSLIAVVRVVENALCKLHFVLGKVETAGCHLDDHSQPPDVRCFLRLVIENGPDCLLEMEPIIVLGVGPDSCSPLLACRQTIQKE